MESQIRLATAAKQSAADFLRPAGDTGTWGTLAFDGNQMEAKTSSSVDAIDPTKQNGEKELVGTMNDPTTVSNGRQPPQAELLQANYADLMNPLGDKVADVIHPVTTVGSRGRISNQGHQPQADTFISPACAPLGYMPHNSNASFPQGLVPIMTTRLDGKNYHCWVHLMEFFLNQIKVAYVLKDPCPSISVEGRSSEEIILAKAAVRKWVDDEYICRHYILNSLCDSLFNQYSRKVYSARELWEELRSVYQEEFGTLRSQVNKYIQFQMVDGVPVLEQVQELNRILNGIMASGIWVDENFHVSVIISKLPPSWKDYRAKLMLEEVLPCNVLMHRLKLEEESRNQCAKGSMGRNSEVQSWEVKKKSSSGGNKKDMMKGPCYNCGKEGHVSKYCPDKEARKPRADERKGE